MISVKWCTFQSEQNNGSQSFWWRVNMNGEQERWTRTCTLHHTHSHSTWKCDIFSSCHLNWDALGKRIAMCQTNEFRNMNCTLCMWIMFYWNDYWKSRPELNSAYDCHCSHCLPTQTYVAFTNTSWYCIQWDLQSHCFYYVGPHWKSRCWQLFHTSYASCALCTDRGWIPLVKGHCRVQWRNNNYRMRCIQSLHFFFSFFYFVLLSNQIKSNVMTIYVKSIVYCLILLWFYLWIANERMHFKIDTQHFFNAHFYHLWFICALAFIDK